VASASHHYLRGNGNAGFSGDGGAATQAMFNQVVGLAWDSSGNLYLADQNNNRVRKVDKNGIITTFAGTGIAATGGTWPTQLFGVSVTMDGAAVPVYDVLNLNSQEQISVQAPFALSGTSTNVQVTTAAGGSTVVAVPVLAAQPGIFILDAADDAATHADGSVVTRASPASPNEEVVLYVTGLGNASNAPQPGQPASLTVCLHLPYSSRRCLSGIHC
jgi:uncharacterized protein (TIGR03437 family)